MTGIRHSLHAALLALALATTASAQLPQRAMLDLAAAKRVMAAAEGAAARLNFPCSIAIVDEGGNLILMERYGDWTAASSRVAIGKARTAATFRRSTGAFEDIIKNGRTAMVALDDFTPLQGGVPIMYNGAVVGAIGVSGSAPPKDEEIALAGIAALEGGASSSLVKSSGLPVSFFDGNAVKASFEKGAVLLDGQGRNYMIHTSRREKAGMSEVHEQDTDVIYVQSGSAQFVTGGELVNAKTISAGEIRGASIRGGERRKLSPGDVIVVPQGVPHWFEQVTAPFTYYVVKVR